MLEDCQRKINRYQSIFLLLLRKIHLPHQMEATATTNSIKFRELEK